jgi:rubrerythrin
VSIRFNADEIYAMAETIEKNGAEFYTEAAGKAGDKDTKKMLREMAAMEQGHFETFHQMRAELTEQEKSDIVYDPNNQVALYLRTMAQSHGSEGKVSPTQKLTGRDSIEEIFNIALGAEKDSVAFYSGLKDFVSQTAGRDKVEAIIREELFHIAMLSQKLADLRR